MSDCITRLACTIHMYDGEYIHVEQIRPTLNDSKLVTKVNFILISVEAQTITYTSPHTCVHIESCINIDRRAFGTVRKIIYYNKTANDKILQ